MGILNVTPDSFSDGGKYLDPKRALERARALIAEGADLIDVGGESTRPGAAPVPPEEEWRRLEPVLKVLTSATATPISVDTRNTETARRALDAGASVVNDVSCARDPGLLKVVAAAGAGYVLMHSRGEPAAMASLAHYGDVVGEVEAELRLGLDRALQAGIVAERICVDPGFGFAKTPEQNWILLEGLAGLAELGRPILVGLSRKRMLRERVGGEPEALLRAGLDAARTAIRRGARIVRVHDVAATRGFLQALQKSEFSID
ncbi:MAG: dihydropteroate synthase [Deltaproteobacteria bacterium]|nr:dihydropteroate synthase [Deltaproteobacteria bacterium]